MLTLSRCRIGWLLTCAVTINLVSCKSVNRTDEDAILSDVTDSASVPAPNQLIIENQNDYKVHVFVAAEEKYLSRFLPPKMGLRNVVRGWYSVEGNSRIALKVNPADYFVFVRVSKADQDEISLTRHDSRQCVIWREKSSVKWTSRDDKGTPVCEGKAVPTSGFQEVGVDVLEKSGIFLIPEVRRPGENLTFPFCVVTHTGSRIFGAHFDQDREMAFLCRDLQDWYLNESGKSGNPELPNVVSAGFYNSLGDVSLSAICDNGFEASAVGTKFLDALKKLHAEIDARNATGCSFYHTTKKPRVIQKLPTMKDWQEQGYGGEKPAYPDISYPL